MLHTSRGRQIRRSHTEAERLLWAALRSRRLSGFKFRRQQPVEHYFADFVCREAKLIVEIDDGHHAQQADRDEGRTRTLEAAGFRVVRYWNHDVLHDTDSVVDAVLLELRMGGL